MFRKEIEYIDQVGYKNTLSYLYPSTQQWMN